MNVIGNRVVCIANLAGLLACISALGGCAYIGLAPVLVDAINNSGTRRYVGDDFEAAAAEACSARGSRYGRVTIDATERISETIVRVGGMVQEARGLRSFTCDFRSDGRIAKFRI